MRRRCVSWGFVKARPLVAVVAIAMAMAGCAIATRADDGDRLRIMVPNPPGSGYDLTARTAAKALEDAGIVSEAQVFNLPGGHGTVGLHRLVYERGNDQLLMLMGLGIIGSQYTQQTQAKLTDTTPIARLIEEPNVVVVPEDSPYRTFDDLADGWKRDPASVSVGGGSVAGGPDHLATMLLAQALGIAPREAQYVRYDGGGELLAALLARQVSVGVSGAGEYASQAGAGDQLRVLAVTSEQRLPYIDAPTVREAGADMVFTNWRGVVAPPGLSDSQIAQLRSVIDQMHDSEEWRTALARNGWTDAYITDDDFSSFIRSESERVGQVLTDLGLAPDHDDSYTGAASRVGGAPSRDGT
jgi:putative tricarboxylic transport membrane protein